MPGSTGIGETQAWRRQGNAETLPSLVTVVRDHFAPLIVGRSPLAIAAIMEALDQAIYHSLYAQAAVSDALYDLQGKLLGLPVHALIGGKCRDAVAAGAILYIKPSLEQTLEGARESHARGFRSFSMKVGVDPRADLRNVAAIREKLGDDVIIRVDANAGMDFDGALGSPQEDRAVRDRRRRAAAADLGPRRHGRARAPLRHSDDDRRVRRHRP